MKWPLVSLGDLVKIKGGGTPDRKNEAYWNGSIPWASVKDFKSLKLSKTVEYITDLGFENSATNLIPEGTIVVPTRMALGKAAVTSMSTAINQDLKALLIADPEQTDRDYLLWFLLSKSTFIERNGSGATVKGVTLEFLKAIAVPLPPLEEQRRIAKVLQIADDLRQKARRMQEELDALAQSLFLDMFGDPALNKKGYDRIPLRNLAVTDGVKCGPFGTQLSKSEFVDQGVPLWGIPQVNRHFSKLPKDHITKVKAEELRAYSIVAGDIVMTRKGTVGNCSVYPTTYPDGMMHSDLLRIRLDRSRSIPEFISTQLAVSRDVERQIGMISHGAVMAGINVGKLKSIEVLVPDLAAQETYVSALSAKQNTQKVLNKQADKVDTLFNSLLQKAFKGELTFNEAAFEALKQELEAVGP